MSSSLILCNNNELFFNRIVTCDEKWILYNQQSPAQWLDWEEAPKHFSKPNLHQKKVTVTIWWFVTHPIHYSFLNLGETIISEKYTQQINEVNQKLQCLQPVLINRMGSSSPWRCPTTHCKTNTSKVEWTATKFCLIHHIHLTSCQLISTSSNISTTFCRKTLPQPTGGIKCFPGVC